jgi:competence protein ComGC
MARSRFSHGFTLIELVVVAFLITLMFFFTFPRVHRFLFANDGNEATRRIVGTIRQMKENALRSEINQTLHLDIQRDGMWITNEAMTEEQKEDARAQSFEFPEGFDILKVDLPLLEEADGETAEIGFYPGGYSDKALIHVEIDREERLSIVVEPFLSEVRIAEWK